MRITKVKPFYNRFLLFTFEGDEGETETRLYDSSLLREGVFEQLDNPLFFKSVFVDHEIGTATWKGELDVAPEHFYEESVPLEDIFTSYFDVKDIEDAEDIVHDAYVNVFYEEPSDLKVRKLIKILPEDIVSVGERWGWYDTEVREKIYVWIDKNKDELK